MVITHNIQAENAQRIFRINEKNKSKNSEKLSSGYKINRAADDAAGLSISEKMRSQVRKLHQAASNVEDGISLIKTADGALSEVHNILGRQRELLVKAANDTNAEEDRQAIEDELLTLEKEFDHIFDDTQFNGRHLFKGHDTIVDGPVIDTDRQIDFVEDPPKIEEVKRIVWIDKGSSPPPDDEINYPPQIRQDYKVFYREEEVVNSVDDNGYTLYDEKSIETTVESEDVVNVTKSVMYNSVASDPKYTNLVKPGDMVGDSGYINVQNQAGNLSLSCAMSQLGVKLDGVTLSLDMYSSSFDKSTVMSADKNTATTTYKLTDDISLSQTIRLVGGSGAQSYEISYAVENNSGADHNVQVRLAFDTMNTSAIAQKGQQPYVLESSFASISVSATGTTNDALGNIEDLYGSWDDAKVTPGNTVPIHTGAGFWWEQDVASGSASLGSVTYGPITLKQDPYELTNKTETHHVRTDATLVYTETTTILPEYLDIQHGANAGEKLPIRLFDLSSENLRTEVGADKPISAFHAENSLEHIDRTVKKISSIRSYYGAMQNRLETTYENDVSYAENLERSESIIRDTDMATEMVQYSKNNVLQEAAQSMISQANKNNQNVLSLLQ